MRDTTETARSAGMAKRLLSFAGLPFLSMMTPFLILPVLARVAGPDAWTSIAVGQSTGAFFALVVAQGYNLVGPTMVSVTPPAQRAAAFRLSVQSRLIVFAPMSILSFFVAWAISPEGFRLEGGLMSLAVTATGLSSAWFMIGLGRPSLIVLYEIVPKMVATGIAVVIVVAYVEVIWYPLLLGLSALGSLILFSRRTVTRVDMFRFRFVEVRKTLRANRSALVTEVSGGAYATLTVAIVTASALPSQSAAYVAGDKLYKIGLYAIAAVGNALHGWVVEPGGRSLARRVSDSIWVHLSLGLLGLVLFSVLGVPVTGLLFGDAVAIDEPTAVGFGVAVLALSLNTSLGRHALLAVGARTQVMVSVLVGAVVGVPLIIMLGASHGAAGASWGLAASESTVVLVQLYFVWRRRDMFLDRSANSESGDSTELAVTADPM